MTTTSPHSPKVPVGGFRGLHFFHNFGQKFRTAISRFPLTFVSIVVLAGMIARNIDTYEAFADKWIFAGVLSAMLSLAFYLFAENRLKKLLVNAINLVLMGLVVSLCATFSKDMSEANTIQAVMLMVSFFLAWFFAAYLSERNSLRWWDNLQETAFQLIVSGVFAGILMGGLSLALVSLDKLFGVEIKDNVYQYLTVFCFVLFMPGYFLSQIKEYSVFPDSFSVSYPLIFKILGLYILLPILAIYTVILYGYLIKIIATWELPNGWVSWLVSILGFVGFMVMIILHPLAPTQPPNPPKDAPHTPAGSVLAEQSKLDTFMKGASNRPFRGLGGRFARIFPLILLPLLVLMFVGIIRRFSDYGITINRLLVLILNLWFVGVSIYLSISRSRQPKWILISFATVAFLSAVGPWSVLNVTEKSLKKELTILLTEAGWTNTVTDKITPLESEKQSRLSDVAYYLQRTYGIENIRPLFSTLGETATVRSLITRLGISETETARKTNSFHINTSEEKSFEFEIGEYSTAYFLKYYYSKEGVAFKSDDIEIRINNELASLIIRKDDTEKLLSLKSHIDKGVEKEGFFTPQELTIEGTDYKLIILLLYGEFKKDSSIEINRLEGLLMVK